MSGGASEEVVRRRWRWLRLGEQVLDLIHSELLELIELDHDRSASAWEALDRLGLISANLGMLLASTDPSDDRSFIGFCDFDSAPMIRSHRDRVELLGRKLAEVPSPRREQIERPQIEGLLKFVRACREELDWCGDWSEEEWVLVHYWAKHGKEETA